MYSSHQSMTPQVKYVAPLENRFRFGENWADFARGLDERALRAAEEGLERLTGQQSLKNKSFLDIGCGSGLHALAALRLGASRVMAVDLDPASVSTTEAVLRAHAPDEAWDAQQLSVFDLDPDHHGRYDVVYSWGVLHHTGAMEQAIEKAAAMVGPGGLFIIALYRKTPFCGFWAWEKRVYANASKSLQRSIKAIYLGLFRLAFLLRGRSFARYVRDYDKNYRGMNFYTDVHDWLGGFPYESVRPREVVALLERLGFDAERDFLHPTGIGLFGTGCDEFTFRSRMPRPEANNGGPDAERLSVLGPQGDTANQGPQRGT